MTPKLRLFTAVLLVLPCLAGCGGSSTSTNTTSPVLPRSVTAILSNGLTGTLTEDRSTVAVGGTVTYTMTLTNPTSQPITYLSTFGPGMYPSVEAVLTVTDPAGQVVYPVGLMLPVFRIGAPVTIAPGQSVTAVQAVSTVRETGSTVAQGYPSAGIYNATATFGITPGTSIDQPQTPVTATAGPLPVIAQ